MTTNEIITKMDTGDFTIECENGRRICVDRCITTPCWVVTLFEVVGTYWDSDYQMSLPIRDIKAQRNFLFDIDAAEYIMELL